MSVLYLASREYKIEFQPEDVVRLFAAALMANSVDAESTVLNPEAVLEHVRPAGGRRMYFVGKEKATYLTKPNEREILQYQNPSNGFIHFVAGDGQGRVAYDPINGGSITVKRGRLVGKRIYRLEAA
jgi:hypothetical protein